ncbi:MAG: GNAT family N-acetyltransferase [Planctomycetota bacterium]|nr:GNAT family N-acetyltransferase [Planctomycetota bacterium]
MSARPSITTDRLQLRPFRLDDASTVQKLAGDERVGRQIPLIPHPYPDGEAETWISTHDELAKDGKDLVWAVTNSENGVLMGAISIGKAGGPHCVELGYWLGVPFWGKGYMPEAARALFDWAFSNTEIVRIQAHHSVTNPASGRVMLKSGMQREGLMPKRMLLNGDPVDIVYYSALKDNWPPSTPEPTESLGLDQLPRSSDRLCLRPLTLDDVETMHRLFCSPGVYEGLASIPQHPDLDFARDRVRSGCQRITECQGLTLLACLGNSSGEVIGEIGLGINWRHRKGGLGYLLDADYRGQGYASEMLQGLIEHAFGPMGLHRLYAATYPENEASKKLLDRNGFTLEGMSRGAYCKEGQYLDGLEWSLLASDPRPA